MDDADEEAVDEADEADEVDLEVAEATTPLAILFSKSIFVLAYLGFCFSFISTTLCVSFSIFLFFFFLSLSKVIYQQKNRRDIIH